MRFFILLFSLLCLSRSSIGQWMSKSFLFDLGQRSYRVYVPQGYIPDRPPAVAICLHGLGGSMYDIEASAFSHIADTAHIILVAPQALDDVSDKGTIKAAWNNGIRLNVPGWGEHTINENVDDVGFINAIVDSIMAQYSIQQDRIYICGASMGGFMAQRIACEAPDRFAAVASIMGTYSRALPQCNPGKVLPLLHIHGTEDEVINWNGEFLFAGNAYPVGLGVEELIRNWIALHHCDSIPEQNVWPDLNADGFYVEQYRYRGANQQFLLELLKINKGKHAWYDYALTGGEIDYAVEIWRFFNRQYFGTTTIKWIDDVRQRMLVYPNPARDWISIILPQEAKSIIIADIYGTVWNTGNLSTKINIQSLIAGTYFLRIFSEEGQIATAKFVKE